MDLRRRTSRSTLLAVDESLRLSNAAYSSHIESSPPPRDRKALPSADILVLAPLYTPSKRSASFFSL